MFSLLPVHGMVSEMMQSVYQPADIAVEGTDGSGNPVMLEFDRSKSVLTKTENGEKTLVSAAEMPLFLKLFFFNYDKTSPESAEKAVKNLENDLKSAGINTEISSVGALGSDGSMTFVIGREKRFAKGNVLEISKESKLPAVLTVNGETFIFSDYHRSVMPLAFPGKIEFVKDGTTVAVWTFLRKEFKQQ